MIEVKSSDSSKRNILGHQPIYTCAIIPDCEEELQASVSRFV